MGDDLRKEVVRHLRRYAKVLRNRDVIEAGYVGRTADRLEAAKIREPSRLDRVKAALPNRDDWSADRGRYAIAIYYKNRCVASLHYASPCTPEEAVEAAKKLAGVE